MSELTEKREYYDDRSLKAVYTEKDGKKEGKYTEYFQNSDKIAVEANYKDGKLDGEYKEYMRRYKDPVLKRSYENGVLREEQNGIDLKKYDQNGEIIYHKNDDEDMEYKNGKPWNGKVHIDHYVYGDHDMDFVKSESYTVKNGKKDGIYSYKNAHGHTIEANYENGILHGKYEEHNDIGKSVSGSYDRGVFTGTVDDVTHEYGYGPDFDIRTREKSVYENGILKSQDYEHNEKRGHSCLWDINKKVTRHISADGMCEETVAKKIKENFGHSEDVKKYRYHTKDGVKDGVYQEIDPRGWVRVEASYNNGKLNGFYKELNSDGTVASQKLYRDGEDITERYQKLKDAARGNVSEEKGKVNPKRSKVAKFFIGKKMMIDLKGKQND